MLIIDKKVYDLFPFFTLNPLKSTASARATLNTAFFRPITYA